MSIVAITDYFDGPSEEERRILGDAIGTEVGPDTEVLLVWHRPIGVDFVEHLPRLRAIQRYGTGYDNLDLPALKRRGIVCCNIPDYGTDEVADTAVAMILQAARGVLWYDRNARVETDRWQTGVLSELRRVGVQTVGVVGAGRIGSSVLLKCRALGFRTAFYDPYQVRGHEKVIGAARHESLEELLAASDVVSVHTPLTDETRGMVNAAFVSHMRRGATFVNTARGALVADLDLLYTSVVDGRLGQVALDVLPEEPPLRGRLIEAWRTDAPEVRGRLVINPHTAYYSAEALVEIRVKAAQNAARVLRGEVPHNQL